MHAGAVGWSASAGTQYVRCGVSWGEIVASATGVCVCLLLQDLLQSCSRGGEEESGRHVL
jgi:hypothetical protein